MAAPEHNSLTLRQHCNTQWSRMLAAIGSPNNQQLTKYNYPMVVPNLEAKKKSFMSKLAISMVDVQRNQLNPPEST